LVKGTAVLLASPKGGDYLIARGSEEYSVVDDKTHKPIATLQNPPKALFFQTSPDAKLLAAHVPLSLDGGTNIHTWERETGKQFPVFRFPGKSRAGVKAAVMSHDNESIAAYLNEERAFHVADVKTGKWIFGGKGHAAPIQDLVFSPDNKLLVSCGL